jgi:hypothetical protein
VDELASSTIRAISIKILFAKLGLVKGGYIGSNHDMLLAMGIWALITVFALSRQLEVLAEFSSILVYIWCGWSELFIDYEFLEVC